MMRYEEVEADTDFADFVALDTGVTVDGVIDTARPADDGLVGGAITLEAGSVNLRQRTSPNTLFIESGEVNVSGALRSGGGAVSLRGGERGTTNVGNVSVTAATIDSDGGAIECGARSECSGEPAVATAREGGDARRGGVRGGDEEAGEREERRADERVLRSYERGVRS